MFCRPRFPAAIYARGKAAVVRAIHRRPRVPRRYVTFYTRWSRAKSLAGVILANQAIRPNGERPECECRERTSADISGANEAVYRFKRYTYRTGTPEMMMYLAKSTDVFVAVTGLDVGRYSVSRRRKGTRIYSRCNAEFIPYVPKEIFKRAFVPVRYPEGAYRSIKYDLTFDVGRWAQLQIAMISVMYF